MTQSIVHVSSIPLIHGNSKQANVSSHPRLAVWGLTSEYDVCAQDNSILTIYKSQSVSLFPSHHTQSLMANNARPNFFAQRHHVRQALCLRAPYVPAHQNQQIHEHNDHLLKFNKCKRWTHRLRTSMHGHLNEHQDDILRRKRPKACILENNIESSETQNQQHWIQRKFCASWVNTIHVPMTLHWNLTDANVEPKANHNTKEVSRPESIIHEPHSLNNIEYTHFATKKVQDIDQLI